MLELFGKKVVNKTFGSIVVEILIRHLHKDHVTIVC